MYSILSLVEAYRREMPLQSTWQSALDYALNLPVCDFQPRHRISRQSFENFIRLCWFGDGGISFLIQIFSYNGGIHPDVQSLLTPKIGHEPHLTGEKFNKVVLEFLRQ
jgi:hypothetical protein